jgi:hypothetical protein
MMEEQFQVNSGDVRPPTQPSNVLSHQLNNNTYANFQFNTNGTRRKTKETVRSTTKVGWHILIQPSQVSEANALFN